MLHKFNEWMNDTNEKFASKRQSCLKFINEFAGFYTPEFLATAYFVIVDKLPIPDFLEFHQAGLGKGLEIDMEGITHKNTYYLTSEVACELPSHFHELVHVVQWTQLGASAFLLRYILEIQSRGYHDAPLEKIAYQLEMHFASGGRKLDVISYVARRIP
jgi:hypothetical protein